MKFQVNQRVTVKGRLGVVAEVYGVPLSPLAWNEAYVRFDGERYSDKVNVATIKPIRGPRVPIPFDTVGFIIEFEGGELDDDQIVEGFQHLIDTGLAWTLQGSYGRMAANLIELGLCTQGRN